MNVTMWKYIWDWVFSLLGIKKTITTEEQRSKNEEYARRYKDITDINFAAIFAARLALIATADSQFVLDGDNARSKLLRDIGAAVWKKKEKLASLALGIGGNLIVPYVQNGQLYFDIATQDRLHIHGKNGEKITGATILAEEIAINGTKYFRYVDYSIENGTLLITNKTLSQHGREAVVDQWKDIQDIAIANVDRVPFGFIKSPIDNRDCNDDYGVPITYGCDKIIEEIKECLEQIKDEFSLKEIRVFADSRLFKRDKNGTPKLSDKLFYAFSNINSDKPIEVFSPEIRESAYYSRLVHLFELLEKAAGTSRGILIKPETNYENKDAVREANRATWAIVTALRDAIQKGYEDFLYACDVLANYYNLTPAGKYEFSFNWDFSLIESSAETWQQMQSLQSTGGMSKAELRAWLTGEDLTEAEKKVEEIAKKEPRLSELIGVE